MKSLYTDIDPCVLSTNDPLSIEYRDTFSPHATKGSPVARRSVNRSMRSRRKTEPLCGMLFFGWGALLSDLAKPTVRTRNCAAGKATPPCGPKCARIPFVWHGPTKPMIGRMQASALVCLGMIEPQILRFLANWSAAMTEHRPPGHPGTRR